MLLDFMNGPYPLYIINNAQGKPYHKVYTYINHEVDRSRREFTPTISSRDESYNLLLFSSEILIVTN